MPFLLIFGSTFLVFAWAILWRNSSLLIATRWRGPRKERRVALTFDDGPDPRLTPEIIEILERQGVKATFFCVGEAVRRHPALVRRLHEAGHLLANHSHEHDWRMNFWHPSRVARSMVLCGRMLARVTGYVPRFYRCPVGVKSPAQALMGWKLGLEFVGWARSARDGGRARLRPEALRRIGETARPGDIILLHDGKPEAGDTVANEALATWREGLPRLIETLRAQGLEPVRLDDLLGMDRALADGPSRGARNQAFAKGVGANVKQMARQLMREHGSPLRLAAAIGVGVLIGCTPMFGLHMLIGLVMAIKLRLNKLAVMLGTHITNPLTGWLVILANIQVGCRLLTGDWMELPKGGLSWQTIFAFGNRVLLYWVAGFPIATTAIALAAAAACYPFFRLLRTRQKKKGMRDDGTADHRERAGAPDAHGAGDRAGNGQYRGAGDRDGQAGPRETTAGAPTGDEHGDDHENPAAAVAELADEPDRAALLRR